MSIEIVYPNSDSFSLLEKFINTMGESSTSFRYFNSRPIEVIKNHLITILLLKDDEPVGYGHLDKEGEDVWFGIAISHKYKGLGYGKEIIKYLTIKADFLEIPCIKLSVDDDNIAAINLYKKFGFEEVKKKDNVLFFTRNLLV